MVLTFTVSVSAVGAPEEGYAPTRDVEENPLQQEPTEAAESASEPTGEQLALVKDISVSEPNEAVYAEEPEIVEDEADATVAPLDETVIEEPIEDVVPEEPKT